MLTYQDIRIIVQNKLGQSERFDHTLEVVKMAEKLAVKYQADIETAKIAALLHDITKYESDETHKELIQSYFEDENLLKWPRPIWHALSAVVYSKKVLGIENQDILDAIQFHTTGRPQMSLIEKIIFVSDFTEPTRKFNNRTYRELAFKDLNMAVAMILKSQEDYLLSIGETPVLIEREALMYYQHLLED